MFCQIEECRQNDTNMCAFVKMAVLN